MKHARWAIASMVLVTVLAAPAARAQELRRFNVSPYVGIFIFDDEQLTDEFGVEVNGAAILGGRVGFAITRSWEIEGGYGYAALKTEPSEFSDEIDDEDIADIDAHLLYGGINYLLGYRDNPTRLLLSAGGGVLMLKPEVGDDTSDPVLELAAGFTHPVRHWITVRGELRDHMTFCSAPDAAGEASACAAGDITLHNIEVSAALQFWLF